MWLTSVVFLNIKIRIDPSQIHVSVGLEPAFCGLFVPYCSNADSCCKCDN
jgi:hypothetical protein